MFHLFASSLFVSVDWVIIGSVMVCRFVFESIHDRHQRVLLMEPLGTKFIGNLFTQIISKLSLSKLKTLFSGSEPPILGVELDTRVFVTYVNVTNRNKVTGE